VGLLVGGLERGATVDLNVGLRLVQKSFKPSDAKYVRMNSFCGNNYFAVGEVIGSIDGASVGSYVGFGKGAFDSGCLDGFALLVVVLVGDFDDGAVVAVMVGSIVGNKERGDDLIGAFVGALLGFGDLEGLIVGF